MLMERASEFQKLRAPQENGEKLIDPSWQLLPEVVERNRRRLAEADYDVQGRSLGELSHSARQALVRQAIAYTSRYRNVPSRLDGVRSSVDAPFILSGHQPQLFHPGVWYKNFVLGGLARQLDGIGIHLLIDSDLCRSVSVRVPTGSVEEPRVEAVPYDAPSAEVPYEERAICDPAMFASFADRVVQWMEPLVRDPMVESMWPLTLERNSGQTNLGLRLAQGRHAYEATWPNDTLELPQSAVCQLTEFAWFVAHILAHLPRFWSAHNDALAAYRQAHRLRNRAQPVPDLAESNGWLEAPFWIWSGDDPRRRPLFARQTAHEMLISDRGLRTFTLALSADGEAQRAVEQLMELAASGIKIRTRALATTLFARLVLSDLFFHGIGGAKYDQVTDQIAQQFCGFEPPQFATVSATLRLPITYDRVNRMHGRDLNQQVRELRFHPERFVNLNGAPSIRESPGVAELIAEKRRWIELTKTPENAKRRHVAITMANEALQKHLAPLHCQLEAEREVIERRRRAHAILESREYSFCLFPRRHFEPLLLDDPPLLR